MLTAETLFRWGNYSEVLMYGTPKTINFPFVSNGKLTVLDVPIFKQIINEALIYLNFGTSKILNFPFGTNGNLLFLSVPIPKHIRVSRLIRVHIGVGRFRILGGAKV